MAFNQNDNSLEVALATKMQLILDQPESDISTGLVNREYEGEFFKIGNTVSIVKPDPDSVVVEVGKLITPDGERQTFTTTAAGLSNNTVDDPANYTSGVNDARLKVRDLTFDKIELAIDKTSKYAFAISDFLKEEGRWDYEGGGLDLAARKVRIGHNIDTMNTLLNKPTGALATENVRALQTADGVDTVFGTPEAPIYVASADAVYENIILEMFGRLYDYGAITPDGQITFGSNPQETKSSYGQIYLPTKVYQKLLQAKYFTDRSTVAADEKVETGKIKTILGLDVNIEPALVPQAAAANDGKHVTVTGAAAGTMCIIAGTKSTVTRAGKVLKPEKKRSETRFADEFHGVEIYGEKVVQPKSCVVAFITFTPPASKNG